MSRPSQSVLFVSHDASRTGAPIFLLRFLRWFRNHHQIPFEILVVSPGELLREFASVGPTHVLEPQSRLDRVLRRLSFPAPDNSHHLSKLQACLSNSNIGLIYTNTIATGRALDFLSFLDCPVICNIHELEHAIRRSEADGNLGLVRNRASSYIAVSHAVKENLVAKHGIATDAIKVIHGFIPTDGAMLCTASHVREQVRLELGIPMDAKLVCACGSIEPRKGSDLFLQVAEKFTRVHTGGTAHFVWIGGNKDQVKAMRKEAQAMPERLVHVIGSRRDTIPYYQASDVLLLPSREDPFPLVMMEAALQGRPIICFDNSGGAPEFVQHDAGFVVPSFDVDAMAAKLALLLSSPELCRTMGETGRKRVLSSHDINTSAPNIAAIIHNTLVRRGDRRASRDHEHLLVES